MSSRQPKLTAVILPVRTGSSRRAQEPTTGPAYRPGRTISVFGGRFELDSVGYAGPMFAAENLRDWLGHTVIDQEGHKIGTLEAVYVDTTSDEPSFITVEVGMVSRHRLVFVPVDGATVSPKAVRVQYLKKVVQKAPAIDTDGELAVAAEPGVFAYYNLDYGSRSERRLARR